MNKDGDQKQTAATRMSDKATAREERLKMALRANLRRRKGQVRARREIDQAVDQDEDKTDKE